MGSLSISQTPAALLHFVQSGDVLDAIIRAPSPERPYPVPSVGRDSGPKRHRSRRGRNRRRGSKESRPSATPPEAEKAVSTPLTDPVSQAKSNIYAALDLGTNNCRLLVAKPALGGFQVLDAFSRTVGLGEEISRTGALSQSSMDKAVSALKICAGKLEKNGVTHTRAIATEACRLASNGAEFVARVLRETGIEFDIISAGEEAALAAAGCAALADPACENVLVFDIGGGSTELVWLDLCDRCEITGQPEIVSWTSLPYGVVTLTDKFGLTGPEFDKAPIGLDLYEEMVTFVKGQLRELGAYDQFAARPMDQDAHLLGTSGTVTTLAGMALGLKKYDRDKVDGTWLHLDLVEQVSHRIALMSRRSRTRHPCIGRGRAEFIVAGCAILEGVRDVWPSERLRVADRGLREGILIRLMAAAGDSELARQRVMGIPAAQSREHPA